MRQFMELALAASALTVCCCLMKGVVDKRELQGAVMMQQWRITYYTLHCMCVAGARRAFVRVCMTCTYLHALAVLVSVIIRSRSTYARMCGAQPFCQFPQAEDEPAASHLPIY